MARLSVCARENNGPWDVGDFAVKFSVDEIGNASQKQTDAAARCNHIEKREGGEASAFGKPDHCDGNAGQATMEAHAALPDFENV